MREKYGRLIKQSMTNETLQETQKEPNYSNVEKFVKSIIEKAVKKKYEDRKTEVDFLGIEEFRTLKKTYIESTET